MTADTELEWLQNRIERELYARGPMSTHELADELGAPIEDIRSSMRTLINTGRVGSTPEWRFKLGTNTRLDIKDASYHDELQAWRKKHGVSGRRQFDGV